MAQGVLHNPSSDRRTTAGVFHAADVGLPAADDKKVVPLAAAKELLRIALNPPQDDMIFPFSYGQEDPAKCWVSLLLRPVVLSGGSGLHTGKINGGSLLPRRRLRGQPRFRGKHFPEMRVTPF